MDTGPDIVQIIGWALVAAAVLIFGAGFAVGRMTTPRR